MQALIFDCDGVLVDTERDGHRVAFNQAFAQLDLGVDWGVELYGQLLKTAGGKERMRAFFDDHGWPAGDHDEMIARLHVLKTDLYMAIIESGQLPLRSGVARLVDEAIAAGLQLAVCSTSNERAVEQVLVKLLGPERRSRFAAVLAGDVVKKKKPDPEIYRLAGERLGRRGAACVVVEDNRNGLLAARGAGMRCVVTTNPYTAGEDFGEADLVVPELGDPPGKVVTLEMLQRLGVS
ncbi:MAG: HAD-IA family hydrolase [Gemmatimonadota bacterium]